MRYICSVIILLLTAIPVISQQIQWRGMKRDGHYNETNLLKSWPEHGPGLITEVEGIGKGYSSAVKAGNTIYVTGMIDTLDYLTAISMEGVIKWQVPYGRSWLNTFPETRSTPTIEEDRIYLVSGTGQLSCINAGTGEQIWTVDADKNFGAEWHSWGVAESPLVYDNKVVCTPGGDKTSMVAFDKMTGELLWQSPSAGGSRSYVSPIMFEYNNYRLILGMTAKNLFAIDPGNGNLIWSYPYIKFDPRARDGAIFTNTPVFKDDEIYITAGYDFPSVMLKLSEDGKSVSEKWIDRSLDNHHHGVVIVGDHIYGSNWINNNQGHWVCLSWDTGEVTYEYPWHNKGNIIYADSMLYVYDEKSGHVGLVTPDPENFDVVSSFRITEGDGPHWAHQTIFDGLLFIRHGSKLMIYNIRRTSI